MYSVRFTNKENGKSALFSYKTKRAATASMNVCNNINANTSCEYLGRTE